MTNQRAEFCIFKLKSRSQTKHLFCFSFLNGHKIVFLHQKGDSQRAVGWKLGIWRAVYPTLRKLYRRRSARPSAAGQSEVLEIFDKLMNYKLRKVTSESEPPFGNIWRHLIISSFVFQHDTEPNTRPVQ